MIWLLFLFYVIVAAMAEYNMDRDDGWCHVFMCIWFGWLTIPARILTKVAR